MQRMSTIAPINWKTESSSDISFKLSYLVFAVKGNFRTYDIIVLTNGEDFSTARINFSFDISSVNTGNAERDNSVREHFVKHGLSPNVTFASTGIQKLSEHHYQVDGDLSILGSTRQVQIDMQFTGLVRTPGDHLDAHFTLTSKIEYLEFIPENSSLKKIAALLHKYADIAVVANLQKPTQIEKAA